MASMDACSSAHDAVQMMRRPAEISPWEARNMRLPPAVQKLKNELLRAEQLLGTSIQKEPEEPTPRLQTVSQLRSTTASRFERSALTGRRPHTAAAMFSSRNSGHSGSLAKERRGTRGVIRPRTASYPSQRRGSELVMPQLARTTRSISQGSPLSNGLNQLLADDSVKQAWQEEQDVEQVNDGTEEEVDDFPALPPPLLSFPSTPSWSPEDATSVLSRVSDATNTARGTCPDSAASTVPMFAGTPMSTSELLTVPKPRHATKSLIANPRKMSKFRRGSSAQRHQEAKERRQRLEEQMMQRRVNTIDRKSAAAPKVHAGNIATHWVATIVAIQKYRVLQTYLQYLHSSNMLSDESRQQAIAVRTIECWYIVVRTKNKILEKPSTAKALRTFLHHIVRTQNTEKKRASTDLIAQFLNDFLPYKNLAAAMQQFRHRIVQLQRYIRSWIACQHARIQLLYLAFERELKARRAELMLHWKNAGRPHISHHVHAPPAARTPIQHLGAVHERVKLLLDQAEGMMNRTSRHAKPKETKALTASMKFILTIEGKRLDQMRAVLKNQRRRQAVADAEAFKQRTTSEARLVTTEDVKVMLAGSNERMMRIFFERAMGIVRQRHTLFLLLTSGGLEELRRMIDRELNSRATTRGLLRYCKSPAFSS